MHSNGSVTGAVESITLRTPSSQTCAAYMRIPAAWRRCGSSDMTDGANRTALSAWEAGDTLWSATPFRGRYQHIRWLSSAAPPVWVEIWVENRLCPESVEAGAAYSCSVDPTRWRLSSAGSPATPIGTPPASDATSPGMPVDSVDDVGEHGERQSCAVPKPAHGH
jgi:hypothetical protein